MTFRRQFLLGSLALPLSSAWAQQLRSLEDPLRLGAENALVDSGLASALQKAFGRDTGVAVQLVRSPALTLLATVERGEVDAALCNAPEAEAKLEKQTLVHDRRLLARGEYVIVGPAVKRKVRDPADVAGGKDVAQALAQIREMAVATPGLLSFLSAGDGSGTHLAEQALWRAAKVAPAAPWYEKAEPSIGLAAQARALNAYALVERGVWAAYGGAPLAVLVDADPLLVEEVHVMRPFRSNHPAGKLFVDWVGGPKGRRVAATHRGYKGAAG
ncbi:MAG: substrate-binding domain-containing protein [Burkholderiales bacterium]